MVRSKILVVEDNPLILKLCSSILTHAGYSCVCAANGSEGLKLWEAHRQNTWLVIADLKMPRQGGLEMVREIWKEGFEPKVIFITGWQTADELAESAGRACSVLMKPFTAPELLAAVKQCAESEQVRRQSAG